MTDLEPVILVRELPPARSRLRQHLPSMHELVRATPFSWEPLALQYLAQGVACGVYNDPGLLFDVLQPGQRIDAASREDPRLAEVTIQPGLLLTDGVWVWSGVLPYYLAVYHLELPARFLQFAAERDWQIDPSRIEPAELNPDAYDAVPDQVAISSGNP
jgi:hypothetical protein